MALRSRRTSLGGRTNRRNRRDLISIPVTGTPLNAARSRGAAFFDGGWAVRSLDQWKTHPERRGRALISGIPEGVPERSDFATVFAGSPEGSDVGANRRNTTKNLVTPRPRARAPRQGSRALNGGSAFAGVLVYGVATLRSAERGGNRRSPIPARARSDDSTQPGPPPTKGGGTPNTKGSRSPRRRHFSPPYRSRSFWKRQRWRHSTPRSRALGAAEKAALEGAILCTARRAKPRG